MGTNPTTHSYPVGVGRIRGRIVRLPMRRDTAGRRPFSSLSIRMEPTAILIIVSRPIVEAR